MENKEIDLIDFIKKIISFFSKNFWLFLVLAIIGAGAGYGYSKTKNPAFSSSGFFSSWIEPSLLTMLLDVFELQIAKNNIKDLSETTDSPIKDLKEVISFEYSISGIIEPSAIDNAFLFVGSKTLIHFEVVVKKKEILEDFEKVIISFFNNNELIKGQHNLRQKTLKTLLEEIEYELETHKNRNNVLLSQSSMLNTLLLSGYSISSLLDIIKLKNDIEYELDNNDIICFVQKLTTPTEIKHSAIKPMIGLIVLLIVAGIIFRIIKP